MKRAAVFFLSLILSLPAGAGKPPVPDLGGIYDRTAKESDLTRNPVIVVPGFLGSRLVDAVSGRVVWGAFGKGRVNPQSHDGAELLALPMEEGALLRDLKDAVRPAGALDRVSVRLFGLNLDLRTYYQLILTLGAGGYRDQNLAQAGAVDYGADHFTCFQFDYDWRRDLAESAARLADFIDEKTAYVKTELAERGIHRDDIKFDIVAHSMGCLVAYYYARYGRADLPSDGSLPPVTWEGAESLGKIVMVGPPMAGSAKALREIVEGRKIGPFLPRVPPAVGATFPAAYQVLPRGRHGVLIDAKTGEAVRHILDPDLWEKMKWGLASPAQKKIIAAILPEVKDPARRRRIALDHQRKCLLRARRMAEALDSPSAAPPGLQLLNIVGDAEPTLSVLSLDSSTGELTPAKKEPGDLTVTRAAALLDERTAENWPPRLVSPVPWTQIMFIFNDHVGLTKDPAFTDNVLHFLLERP